MNLKNLYNKKYFEDRKGKESYRPKLKKYENAILKYKPDTVLDVGCGSGFLVDRLRGKGIHAWGIDFSENAGTQTRYFLKENAKKIPFADESFDVVFSSDFFEHLHVKTVPKVYEEMKRVCKKDGVIIALICTNERKWDKDHTHMTKKPWYWWRRKIPKVKIL